MKFGLKLNHKPHLCPLEIILMGGLGNQLFQIANGISLAIKGQRALFFNTKWYETNKSFAECLSLLGLKSSVNYFINIQNSEIQFKESQQNCSCLDSKFIEKMFCYSEIAINKERVSIHGYYQSERYFEEYKEQIKNFFNSKMQMREEKNLVVHIRLGDMFLNKNINKVHGTLPVEYYLKAIELQKTHFDEILCITDSPELANRIYMPSFSKNFNDKKITIISGENSLEAFEILKSGRNIITSNSTFSWWAAYLSSSKFVIAPRQLFQQEQLRVFCICDHYPSNWILI